MNISIDFDETYTEDPELWNAFIRIAQVSGHTIYCVTARYDHELESRDVANSIGKLIGFSNCIFTNRMGKKATCNNLGVHIDVWIDDNPSAILMNVYND